MTDEFRTRNKLSGDVGDNSAIVQVHHVSGDVLFVTDDKRPRAAARSRLNADTVEQAVLGATALATILLLGWRYFLSASQRKASR
jgi:hypothetical protein